MNDQHKEWLENVKHVTTMALDGYIIEAREHDVMAWQPMHDGEGFFPHCEYRAVKPTFKVNGIDVPRPMTTAPDIDRLYFIPCPGAVKFFCVKKWKGDSADLAFLARNLIHNNKGAAIDHAQAMLNAQQDEDQ